MSIEKSSKSFPAAFPFEGRLHETDLGDCEIQFGQEVEDGVTEWAIVQPEGSYIGVNITASADGHEITIGGGAGNGPTRWELRRVDLPREGTQTNDE